MGGRKRPNFNPPPGSVQVGPLHWATPDGNIFSTTAGRYLKPGIGTNGRTMVSIRGHRDAAPRTYYVHILVCSAFHGPRPVGKVVSHLDGRVCNNHKENLAWETQKKNLSRRLGHGTDDKGFSNTRSCVNPEEVDWVRDNPDNLTMQQRANALGISRTTISRIVNNQRYKEEP